MAEETSDAMLAVTTDVEMKEEPPAEVCLTPSRNLNHPLFSVLT